MPYITKYASSLAPTFGWYVDTTHTEKVCGKLDDGGRGIRERRAFGLYIFIHVLIFFSPNLHNHNTDSHFCFVSFIFQNI